MRTVLLCSLLAVAAFAARGTQQPVSLRQPLEARREYVYQYDGVLVSGLPIQTDAAATRFNSEVTVQMVDDRTIHMKLDNFRIAASHVRPEQLKQQQKLVAFEMLEERTLDREYEKLIQLPVRAVYRNGQVSDVQFDSEDQAWSKNIKRAVLNMLQLNVDQSQGRQSQEEQRSLNGLEKSTFSNYYSVIEKTIEGDCEVSYNIVRESDSRVVVTKSVNFDRCSTNVNTQVSYGQRFESECEQCEKQSQIVNPHTVYTYTIEKDQMKTVEVNSAYQVVLKDQPMLKTETTGRLTLKNEQEIRSKIETPSGQSPKEDLVYSNEWEELVERFYKNGDKEENFPYERFETKMKMQQIEKIIEKLSRTEENKPESAHMLARLVLLQRMLSKKELSQFTELYEKADEKVQSLMQHSLAIAGTYNTINHLIQHIEKEEINTIKASHLLKSIAETPFPSERIVELLTRLAESPVAEKCSALRQSAWLSAGAVMRGVVGQTRDNMLVDENNKEIKQKFVRLCMNQFEKARTIYEKVLALKTLANAGIDLSIYELTKIINDPKEHIQVRIEAVEATRLLKDSMPRKLQNILLPLFKDNRQPSELRMVALVRIMHTLPRSPVLAQIFFQMQQETNQQVAAFTYRTFSEAAQSTHPCFKQVSVETQQLLSTSRFVPREAFDSFYYHLSLFSENTLSGTGLNIASLFGSDSNIPKHFTASIDTMFVGNWNKYLGQFAFSQQNIEQLIQKVVRRLENSPLVTRGGRRVEQSFEMLKELSKKLNIRQRASQQQQPHAMLYLRYKEMDFTVLPIDEKIIDELADLIINNGRVSSQQLQKILNREHKISAHAGAFFYESIRKMPTTLGLPLTVSGKVPTVMSVQGDFEMELLPLGLRVKVNAQPTVAATHVSTMKIWIPVFEQGVKVITTLEMSTPLKLEIDASLKTGEKMQINYKFDVPQSPLALRASRRPVAFHRFPKNSRDYVEATQRTLPYPYEKQLIREIDQQYELIGMQCRVNGLVLSNWEQTDAALFCEQHIEFTAEPISKAKPITGRVEIDNVVRNRIETPSESRELFADEFADNYKNEKYDSEEEDVEYTPRKEEHRRQHFDKRVEEWKKSTVQSKGYTHRMMAVIEQADKKSEMTIRTECDEQISYCRVSLDARRPAIYDDERSEWTMKAKTSVFLPRLPSSISDLKEQQHREIQTHSNIKWGSSKQSEITIKAQLGQSPSQAKWIQILEKNSQKTGLSAYEQLIRAARLNEVKIVTEYENVQPLTVVYMKRAFDLFKAANLWSTSQWSLKPEEQKEYNKDGRIYIRATIEPVSRRFMNVSVETDSERVQWQSLPLGFRMPLPTIARGSMKQQMSTSSSAECRVQVDRVNTFDDVSFRVPLTTCYSVLSKDCSVEYPTFAVLAKKLTTRSEKLAVKIVDEEGNRIELIPEKEDSSEENQMTIKYNEKVIKDEQKLNEKGIEIISRDVVLVKLNDVQVQFDGYNVKQHISRRYNNKQCGLCGHYDGERTNEFRNADGEETSDLEEFHRSFLVKDMKEVECEVEEDRVSKKENYKRYEEENYYNEKQQEEDDEESLFDNEYNYESKKNQMKNINKKQYKDSDEDNTAEPVEKTRIVEFSHRVCFSKDPVMECPRGSQIEKTQEQKVHFTCLPRQQTEARKLLKQAREGKILRLSDYPVSYVESVTVPKSCEVY